MGAGRRRRLWTVVVGLALTAAACSGGGGDGDPVAEGNVDNASGEKELQFTGTGKVRLAATLTTPVSRGALPGVLIVPGPGPTSRDGLTVGVPLDNLYKDLSKAFVAAGMATFRYDRRGTGGSTLEPGQEPNFEDMVADAQEALNYFGERGEIDGSRLAVVGHDMSGPIALKLAATDTRVKSVALVAVPGRPQVDVWAEELRAVNGQESADAFRAIAADLVATGKMPARDRVPAPVQTVLPVGQDALYRTLFALDPLAEAPGVRVPVLIALGEKSTSVYHDDADRLRKALGGPSEVVVAANASATLQALQPPREGDPSDMSTMGGGALIADAPRDQPTVARITSFLGAAIGARPA